MAKKSMSFCSQSPADSMHPTEHIQKQQQITITHNALCLKLFKLVKHIFFNFLVRRSQ